MANYPTSLDVVVPVSGTTLESSADHANMHNQAVGSAVVALQTKLGVNASTPALNLLPFGVGAGSTTWGSVGTQLTLVNSTFNSGTLGTAQHTGGTASSMVIDPTNTISVNLPQGFVISGKIVVTVSTNNITVALKTMAGADASSTTPIYCRIGDTIRTITTALSVTRNAGTNWFNAGATGLATNEIDYFVYLGYNATDGVVIGFARFGSAQQYSDFNTTSTNEKYCAISTITTASATDNYENIGRFAATLSATASFNWSVPAYTPINLIQRPTLDTRQLTYVPTLTGVTSPTGSTRYWLKGNTVYYYLDANGTGSTTAFTATAPFTLSNNSANSKFIQDNAAFSTTVGRWDGANLYKDMAIAAWTASGARGWTGLIIGSI